MERVTATASGVLVCEGQRAPDPVLRLLGRSVDFEPGVTLASLAALFHRYPGLQDLSPFISLFLSLFSPGAQNPADSGGQTLELFRTVDMQGNPGTPKVLVYMSLKVADGSVYHPLDLFSPQALGAMPIYLGKLRHTVFGDTLDTVLFDTDYTLFEVLDSLLWELSFYTDKTRCGLGRTTVK